MRRSRVALNEVDLRLCDRLDEGGIEISSTTSEVSVRLPDGSRPEG